MAGFVPGGPLGAGVGKIVKSQGRKRNPNSGVAPANQTKEKGQKRKVHMNFAHFFSVVFFLRKTSTIHISNFCSRMPLRNIHELTFLWFGLPGPLLTHPNFLVRIFSSGVGVFHVNGWGPKSLICPSKPGRSNFLGGISRDFAGISRWCPQKFEKKRVCFQFSAPTIVYLIFAFL